MAQRPAAGLSAPVRRGLTVVGAAAILLGFGLHHRAWIFLCDDAYISFRYAQNLAEHGELVFNVAPPEYVEGYTNFLWVVLLAVLHRVGGSPELTAGPLCLAFSLTSLGLATALVARLRRRFPGVAEPADRAAWDIDPVDLVPAALLAASPEFVVWASGGLETSFALALGLGALLAWSWDRPVLAAALTAALVLTRLDGLGYVAVFGLVWLGLAGAERARDGGLRLSQLPWARLGVALATFVVPVGAHFLWRHAYYGQWLPNTWAIKHHGTLLRDTYGSAYLGTWAMALQLWALSPLIVLARFRHLLVVAPATFVALYAWWIGGDFMAYSRFMLPATALAAVGTGWLLADLGGWIGQRTQRPAFVGATVGAALAGLLASQIGTRIEIDRAKPWVDGKWEGVMGMGRFANVRVAAGRWFAEHLPPETRATVGAAGAMPYGARIQILDAYGLVDPELAATAKPVTHAGARPGHQIQASMKYLKSRDPDLLCHVGYAGPGRPTRRQARQRGGGNYVWACAPVGTIDDPWSPDGTIDGGNYCCLRPANEPVGPFGRPGGLP